MSTWLRSFSFVLLAASACGDDTSVGTGGAGGGGAGGEAPFVRLPEVLGVAPFEDINPDPHLLEVNLVARENELALYSGPETRLLTYNDQLPGPMLHARVGDRVVVHFTNELDEPTTIHWHGLRISDRMDGSPLIQTPVMPGETFDYDFDLPDAGTFWYHTHLHQIEQFEKGLYGAIVVHEAEAPVFSTERLIVLDDIRLGNTNQVSGFLTSGPDIGRGRIGNTLLVNGRPEPLRMTIPNGAIERWRFVLATNALSHGLVVRGADTRLIATDGGLLPKPIPTDRVEVAPGQRYEFEVRPLPGAREVALDAMILVLDENDQVVEAPFPLVRATVSGDVEAAEPVYPSITLPDASVDAEISDWKLSGGVVDNTVQFTINGKPTFVGDEHEHVLLQTFQPNQPVKIRLKSEVSPEHPFHIHGQFFQIIERSGRPVDEPGLKDTVHVRGAESVTILSYFENPGRWMVHCHISEHSENGMMADIQIGEPLED